MKEIVDLNVHGGKNNRMEIVDVMINEMRKRESELVSELHKTTNRLLLLG